MDAGESATNVAGLREMNVDWSHLISLLGITKNPHEIQDDDVVGKELPSVEMWAQFYHTYSKWKGFSIRVDNVRKDSNKVVWQRRWVCSREGFRRQQWLELENRQKAPKAITRVGCKAFLRITLDREKNLWFASSFNADHNHELASPYEIQFLPGHRQVPDTLLAQAKSMRRAGIRTMSILDYMAQQYGGRDRLPFLRKDMYNRLGEDRRSTKTETDSEGALGYLTCLAIRDGHFFCRFNVDEEDRLHTIFWSDGISRSDYKIFGEVLAFDTTYRTNAYNKPLMILVGVNHHFRTVIFGVALLSDETTPTFKWILEQFLECMEGTLPKVVITDGDLAMRAAIEELLPNSVHRLCSWHLSSNASTNVPIGEFKIQFSKLMYNYYTEEEFEERWADLVEANQLHNNVWVSSIYKKKKLWAETFLRGHFFGGMRTTQRCESMNSYMRRFLESKHLLRDFVSEIDRGIQNIRHTEMQDDFTTKHTQPVIPPSCPLHNMYEYFAKIVTRNIYNLIAKEIDAQNGYSVNSSEYTPEFREYTLSKYPSGEIRHKVRYFPVQHHLWCSCLMLQTDGTPCRHIFTVIKHLGIQRIPETLVRTCWRRDIKQLNTADLPSSSNVTSDLMEITRLGTLTADFNDLGFYASKFEDTYNKTRTQIRAMTQELQLVFNARQGRNDTSTNTFRTELATANNIIRDPIKVKTKGREKEATTTRKTDYVTNTEVRRKRCKLCNELGHNRATCSTKNRDSTIHDADYSTLTAPLTQTQFSEFSTSTMRGDSDNILRFEDDEEFNPFNFPYHND